MSSRRVWKLYAAHAAATLSLFVLLAWKSPVATRLVLGALIAGGVLLAGWVAARRAAERLRRISAAVERLAAGGEADDLSLGANDEIGTIETALVRLAASERERMASLDSDRSKLLTILGGMVEGVVAVDGDERLLHVNAMAARLLGQEARDLLGKRIWESTRQPQLLDTVRAVLGGKAEASTTLRLPSPAGERSVELRAAPLRDATGGIAGAVLVLDDVTELRRLEAVRRDFVANVSHELKTPITAIRGLIETLIDDPALDGKMRDRFLEKIGNQSLRLSALVTDLLTLARLESDGGIGELKPLDLRTPVLASAGALLPSGENLGLEVHVLAPENPIPVLGDEEALRQATTNLLDNALKYTARGGRIWLRLSTTDDRAVLEVEDTGIGVSPEHLPRIFERFYRVDKARSRQLGGTGLGLSIVKHVCLVHGGDVAVESTPGKGSLFRVRLPLAVPGYSRS
ncbi:MAG TPA: ATP-binding protein [Candidatus Polarisedimenticolaceae bacterium]|nr:ATP-binding protein [Candidatus Polarisedimenticolaceae bacterium]